ncbi:hypothetical protein Tco_0158970 [Tanacetum coccineum]
MQTARDRQKIMADKKRKPMDFQVGDKVIAETVSPLEKGCVHFWQKRARKLKPRYVEDLSMAYRKSSAEPVAYKLELSARV